MSTALQVAKSVSERQVQMASGKITPEMMQQFFTDFAKDHAETVTFSLNAGKQGPYSFSFTGPFQEAMGRFGNLFLGQINDVARNISYKDLGDGNVEVESYWEAHREVDGKTVPGSIVKGLTKSVVHVNDDGLVTSWDNQMDENLWLVQPKRAVAEYEGAGKVAIVRSLVEKQISMALGKVDAEMMGTFLADFASYFAAETECAYNPTALPPGPAGKGTLADTMPIHQGVWEGFINTAAENLKVAAQEDGTILVEQLWTGHRAVDGVVVPLTNGQMRIWHYFTLDENNKVTKQVTEFDTDYYDKVVQLEKCQRMMNGWNSYYSSGDVKQLLTGLFADEFTYAFNGNVASNGDEIHATVSFFFGLIKGDQCKFTLNSVQGAGNHLEIEWNWAVTLLDGSVSAYNGRSQAVYNKEGKVVSFLALMPLGAFRRFMAEAVPAAQRAAGGQA